MILAWGELKAKPHIGRAKEIISLVPVDKRYCIKKTKKGFLVILYI
ncbi:hypothetical protein [Virgibacillus ndiopensis]